MALDPSLFTKKIHQLSIALIISGALNVCVLSFVLFWTMREHPPTPYCELKPASFEQQQRPLADQRGCAEVLSQLYPLSFSQLVNRLTYTQVIENGFAERDLALACLQTFHHFDIQRALPKSDRLRQERLLAWKPQGKDQPVTLVIYPDLSQEQYDALIEFSKREHWPLTPEGLFLALQKQKEGKNWDEHLIETFVLTSEFWTVELLFNRTEQRATKQELLEILLEGSWAHLKKFADQQRQLHDSSEARRQKFLLDYIKEGSSSAAALLLKGEWDFALKKLDDQQAVAVLEIMPHQLSESERFAKEMLASPRSSHVWQKASQWLYAKAKEPLPREWNYESALTRFCPEIAKSILSKANPSLPKIASPPLKLPQGASTLPAIKTISSLPGKSSSLNNNRVPETKGKEYVVQEKDSLWKIARRFDITVDDIRAINRLSSDVLKPGTILKIPERKKVRPK